MSQRLLIFTDLDGSLLDHYSYSHEAADALLDELEQNGIPVILASSKTRAELKPLRHELGNQHPFIIENGAAVCIPHRYFNKAPHGAEIIDDYWVKAFCQPRQHWLSLIDQQRIAHAGAFTTFSESGVEDIMAMTGLSTAEAKAASLREYGEPVKWEGTAEQKADFIKALEQSGARVLTGGRFLHVSGDSDKGKALQWLIQQYELENKGIKYCTIAIGDSQNDIAMMELSDYAVVIRSPAHDLPTLSRTDRVVLTDACGPEGWVEGIQSILHSLSYNPRN